MDLVLGEWVKRRRRVLDMTQQDLAKRAFCSIHTVRKLESGDLKPSRALALQVSRALALDSGSEEAFIRFARTPDAVAAEGAFSSPISTASTTGTTRAQVLSGDSASKTGQSGELLSEKPPPIRFHPPAALTAALGREHDLAVITKVLRLPAARLVTLTGPPGTGKTRLSLEVAAELTGEFEQGVAFVALAPVADPALVENAIARVLDVREAGFSSLTAALHAFLRDKQLLLVLDNFEHLLGSTFESGSKPSNRANAPQLVQELLSHAPRLKILTTSREPLHVYGEREIPVSPLGLPQLSPLPPLAELELAPAVQLFIERAQAVRPDLTLTPENAEAVARLCVRLDGLPLAIEMAAARARWESPQTLLNQLSRQIQGLAGSARDRTPRQQTLRGAIEWSYNLLDTGEQRVFRHLGVFRGGFNAEAANAICDAPVNAILENLVEKSLIKREPVMEGASRYTLLEMIREFALDRLVEAGEAEAAHERHWAFFADLAKPLEMNGFTGLGADPLELGKRELDNLQSALDWAVSSGRVEQALTLGALLADYWYAASLVTEALDRLARLLDTSGDIKPEQVILRVRVRTMYAQFLRMTGDYTRARPLLEETVVEWRSVGDAGKSSLGFALLNLSRLTLWQGDFGVAHATGQEALDLFVELGDEYAQGSAWRRIGEWALSQANFAYAFECLDRAVELQGRNDNHFGRGVSLLERGDIHRAMQAYDLAQRDYDAAFNENQLAPIPLLGARILHRLGINAALAGDPGRGKELLKKSLLLILDLGASGTIPLIFLALAYCAVQEERIPAALHWLGAMDASLERQNVVLVGPEVGEYARVLERLEGQAGRQEMEAWRTRGRELTIEKLLEQFM